MRAHDHEALLSMVAATADSIAVYELDARVVYANPATERLFGKTLDEMRGHRLFELFPDATGNAFHAAFDRVARGGPAEHVRHYYPPFDAWFDNHLTRVGERVHVHARDVTSDMRRQRRLEAVARISSLVTRDDADIGGTLEEIARALAEVLDAHCVIALRSTDGKWLEVAARVARDEATGAIMRDLPRWPIELGHPGEAIRTRQPLLHVVARGETVAAQPDDMREVSARFEPSSILAVPLVVADDAIGVVIASRRQGQPPLNEDDRLLATEIAPSVGLHVAHVFRRAEATTFKNRLVGLADALPALVSFIDTERRYVFVNAAYEQWYGRPRAEVIGRKLDEVLAAGAASTVREHVLKALEGTPQRFRMRVPYPTGDREIDGQAVPVRREDGTVEGAAGLVQDVTVEARLAEVERERGAAQERATGRLRSLLAVTGALAAASEPDDVARVLVDEGYAALGATMSGMWLLTDDGDTLEMRRHRGLSAAHAAVFARVARADGDLLWECVDKSQPIFVESRADYARRYPRQEALRRPDPPPPVAFALLPLVFEGRAAGCLNFTFHDERRLTGDDRTYIEVLASHGAEALRRSRLYAQIRELSETREAMIQASPAAIMLLDEEGHVHAWNPAAERIFGWSASEVLGRFLPVVAERTAEYVANLRKVIDGTVIHGVETRRRMKNGEWIDVELYAAPVRRSDGRTMCLSIVVDATARKESERAHARLMDEAVSARREAEEANRSKDEFLAMLGHELRNPLAPIITALDLMRMHAPDVLSRERAVVERQVTHLTRLVDDLLEISRITRGKVELRREPTALAKMIERALETSGPLLEARNHRMTLDVDDTLALDADPTRIAQVLANLLTNAAKYTPPGGNIEVRAVRRGSDAVVTVRDDGVGIEAEMLPRVFDLFVQAEQSSARTAGGLGLGLAIVKNLVELHGGTVSAESRGAGKGSVVTVVLPALSAPAAVVSSRRAAVAPPPSSGGRRILVVDDNEDAATLLGDALRANGHDARTAFDAPSALEMATAFDPELAVLDIGLPVMDGYELAERLRALPLGARLRIIAVTGYGQKSDRERSKLAGFEAHLAKPVQMSTILELVNGRAPER